MPKGICGIAGQATTLLDINEDESRTTLALTFVWDGTSTWPDCHGNLDTLHLTNNHDEAWEAVFDRTGMEKANGGQDIVIFQIDPHSDVVIDAVALGAVGLADAPDIGGVSLRQKTTD